MKKINGPIVPLATGNIVYQVTLASGMIITNPAAFGIEQQAVLLPPLLVGENGQVLTIKRDDDAFWRFERFTNALMAVPKQALDEAERA